MADMNRLSEKLIDVAERFADVVDAVQGKGSRKGNGDARWLVLPAAGAALYALATSSSSTARRTRGLMRRAKDRATDLPDAALFGRVKDVTADRKSSTASTRNSGQSRTQRRSRPRTAQRRRKATAAS